MKSLFGIILLVVGLFFAIQGYELKQTMSAKLEREVSGVLKLLSKDNVKAKDKLNTEANIKLVGGGVAALLGLTLTITGIKKKNKPSS